MPQYRLISDDDKVDVAYYSGASAWFFNMLQAIILCLLVPASIVIIYTYTTSIFLCFLMFLLDILLLGAVLKSLDHKKIITCSNKEVLLDKLKNILDSQKTDI